MRGDGPMTRALAYILVTALHPPNQDREGGRMNPNSGHWVTIWLP